MIAIVNAAESSSMTPERAMTLLNAHIDDYNKEQQSRGDKTKPISVRQKVRFLVGIGLSVNDTSKCLDIRYQQVYRYTEDIRSGQTVDRCSVCNRPLHDPEHQKAKIGPVCQIRKSLEGKNFKPQKRVAG